MTFKTIQEDERHTLLVKFIDTITTALSREWMQRLF